MYIYIYIAPDSPLNSQQKFQLSREISVKMLRGSLLLFICVLGFVSFPVEAALKKYQFNVGSEYIYMYIS